MARLRLHLPKPVKAKQRKAVIVVDTGRRLELPFAPVAVTRDGSPQAWTAIARSGRRPAFVSAGAQLRTWTGSLTLAHPDYTRSVQHLCDALEEIADRGHVVHFHAGGPERGRWRISGLTIDVSLRVPGSNDAARATAGLTLTEASDVIAHVGPLSGGKKPPKKTRPGHAPGGSEKGSRPHPGAPRTYTVKAGDTLWAIAGRVYDDPSEWPRIADANGIRDPRKLRVGKVLRIP